MLRDEEGFPVVKVADIVEYLKTLPQDANVFLDKNGWEDGPHIESVRQLIKETGLFDYNIRYGLCINN